jgi:Tfp pilus assembly protein PilF
VSVRCSSWFVLGPIVLAASGCLHGDRPVGPGSVAVGQSELTPTLGARQVADIQVALGRTLEQQGDLEQAQVAYLEALKQDPNRGDASARLAVLYDRQGKVSESGEYYRRATASQGENPALYCNRGYSLYLQRRWTEAEASLRQAIALAPGNQRAHNNLGLVLAHTGKATEALDEFRKAGCTDAECHVNLALALAVEGDWAGAHASYEQAASLDPGSAAARKGLQQIEELMARAPADAEALLRADTLPANKQCACRPAAPEHAP